MHVRKFAFFQFKLMQGGKTDLIQRIDNDVTNMNTISKGFIAIPWKFACSLTCHVQNKKLKAFFGAKTAVYINSNSAPPPWIRQ